MLFTIDVRHTSHLLAGMISCASMAFAAGHVPESGMSSPNVRKSSETISAYGYAYMLTDDSDLVWESFPCPWKISGTASSYFTPVLNLSTFKKPVMKVWGEGTYSLFDEIGALNKGRNYVEFDYSDNYTLLPNIDGVRIGLRQDLWGRCLTIGEMPENKEDIVLSGLKMNILKGIGCYSDEENEKELLEINMVQSSSRDFWEAEVSYTHENLSTLTSACTWTYVYDMQPVQVLGNGSGEAEYTCVAVTPSGEVSMIKCATEDNGSGRQLWLLPSGTSEIRIRFRSSYEASIYCMEGSFCEKVVQPGYREECTPRYDLEALTGIYGDIDVGKTQVVPTGTRCMDVNTAYDFNGDGLMDFYSKKTNDLCGYNTFGVDILSKNFAKDKVLGFVAATSSLTLGFEEASVFSVDKDFNKTTLYEVPKQSARFALIDYDNDGQMDFLNITDNTVVMTDGVSKPVVSRLSTMTREEYYNIIPPGDNPLGSGLSVIGGGGKLPPAVFTSYIQTDINGDGYPDFVDASSGNYYMNLGDGRFVKDSFGGTLLFRDFDNDGINDFLVYNSKEESVKVYLQRISGEPVERKLINGFRCSDDIWCRDFDGDGDVDILIPFNASDNNGLAFLVMFENNGQGSFKKREYPIDCKRNFRCCVDWNADGKYEVLTDMETDRTSTTIAIGKVYSYAVDGMNVNTTPEYIITKNYTSGTLNVTADIDNSGRQWLIFDEFILLPSSDVNTCPDQPQMPTLVYDDNKEEITIMWNRGSDKETAPADLTYELRVGTTPDSDDVVSAAATKNGCRLNLLAGNCGYQLMRKLNTTTWPQGKIYVSIQAIDASGRGSVFSSPAVFEKKTPATGFTAELPAEHVAVYEKFPLKISVPVDDESRVSWNLSDGEIVSESATEVQVMFTTPGTKTVTMTVTSRDGSSASLSREVTVVPVRFEKIKNWSFSPDLALDLDLDGKLELHGDYDYFFEGDMAGNYTKINRMYNTKSYSARHSADINRDGLPDIVHFSGHLINEGDKSMNEIIPDVFVDYHTFLPDLDHDGFLEVSDGYRLMKNSGDYIHYTSVDTPFEMSGLCFYDVNGDGWQDVISGKRYYENQGRLKFVEKELPVQLEEGLQLINVGDFDGDGRTDYVVSTSDGCYWMVWSDGSRTELGRFEQYGYTYIHCPMIDFDNNGCMDLIVIGNNGSQEAAVILFNPNRSFTTVKKTGRENGPYYYRTDGKMGMKDNVIYCADNEAPSAPTGVEAVSEDGYLMITWNAAKDKETSATNMRYNLSVRHKDAEGEQSYHISPLNGGFNGVNLPTDAHLINGTCYAIPLISMPTGAYEIKVQAVDGRCQVGNFSQPLYYDVTSAGYEAPKEAMVGNPVTITFNADVNLSAIDYGADAVVEKVMGQIVSVYWTSAGEKTINATGVSFKILVHPALDAFFSLPEHVESNARVYVACDNLHKGKWLFFRDSGLYIGSDKYWEQVTDFEVDSIDGNAVVLRFPYRVGTYKVRHVLEESYGSNEYESTPVRISGNVGQCISIVDIDDKTGKYCVHASETTDEEVLTYMVFRETTRTGEYEYLGDVQSGGVFIDTGSAPNEHTSRYALRKRLWYGESALSPAHQPIHAQISMGIHSEWNISWNKYEGREASTYRVLRGSNPQSLECIAEVSGNTTSYTDHEASGSFWYYAVETLIEKPVSTRTTNVWRSRSNVVVADPTSIESLSDGQSLSVRCDGFALLVSGIPSPGTLSVFNAQGVKLLQQKVSKGEIRLDGNGLPHGMYILNHVDRFGRKCSVRFMK